MQKTLSLIIAAAIIYSIVQMKMQSPKETSPTTKAEEATEEVQTAQNVQDISSAEQDNVPVSGNFFEKTISRVLINALKTEEGRLFFENLLQPMNKPITDGQYTIKVDRDLIQSMFKINSFGEGKIGHATCGHIVSVKYQLLDINNSLISEDTKTFTLGSKIINPNIDAVIVGQMVGQTRQALIPASMDNYKLGDISNKSPYKVNIVLNSILPNNYINVDEVKIFDDEIAYKTPLLCGDKVKFMAKITRLSDGAVLYDSVEKGRQIDIKIGDINYPLIISYALHGKVPVGTRTVIARGKSFKALGSNVNKMLNQDIIHPDEYLMLELTNFQTE